MKLVVTGGAGFIGAHLVNRLLAAGHDVVALDNFVRPSPLARQLSSAGAHVIEGDVRDIHTVRMAMQGARRVYHLAAQSNVMDAEAERAYTMTTNVIGTRNVLQAAREVAIERVVFTSSREIYGEAQALPVAEDTSGAPKNIYGKSKAEGERLCRHFSRRYGLDVSVVRLANVYGPGDTGRVIPLWIDRVAHDLELILFGGEQLIDFIAVDCVTQALWAAGDRALHGQPVNIGSGVGSSLHDLARRIQSLSERRVNLRILPARSAEVARFVAEVTRMRTLLGVEPPADPLEALGALVNSATPVAQSPRRL